MKLRNVIWCFWSWGIKILMLLVKKKKRTCLSFQTLLPLRTFIRPSLSSHPTSHNHHHLHTVCLETMVTTGMLLKLNCLSAGYSSQICRVADFFFLFLFRFIQGSRHPSVTVGCVIPLRLSDFPVILGTSDWHYNTGNNHRWIHNYSLLKVTAEVTGWKYQPICHWRSKK